MPLTTLGRPQPARTIAMVAWVGLGLLAVCVHWRITQSFDIAVRDAARPHDEWQQAQLRADLVVEGLRPARMVWLPAVTAVVMSLLRRSPRPVLLAGGVGLLAVGSTLLIKMIMARPDPHAAATGDGGSFPSGHTVSVIVCLGLALLLVRPHPPRWAWLGPLGVGAVMGVALVVEAAHWATDVVGGALLAIAILSTAAAVGGPGWAARGDVRARRRRPATAAHTDRASARYSRSAAPGRRRSARSWAAGPG